VPQWFNRCCYQRTFFSLHLEACQVPQHLLQAVALVGIKTTKIAAVAAVAVVVATPTFAEPVDQEELDCSFIGWEFDLVVILEPCTACCPFICYCHINASRIHHAAAVGCCDVDFVGSSSCCNHL